VPSLKTVAVAVPAFFGGGLVGMHYMAENIKDRVQNGSGQVVEVNAPVNVISPTEAATQEVPTDNNDWTCEDEAYLKTLRRLEKKTPSKAICWGGKEVYRRGQPRLDKTCELHTNKGKTPKESAMICKANNDEDGNPCHPDQGKYVSETTFTEMKLGGVQHGIKKSLEKKGRADRLAVVIDRRVIKRCLERSC